MAQRLAAWLMERPWCGALLASEAAGEIEGTLPMSLAGAVADGRQNWRCHSDGLAPQRRGLQGLRLLYRRLPGLGQHGSMSRHEMNNTLIARARASGRLPESSPRLETLTWPPPFSSYLESQSPSTWKAGC